MQPPKLFISYSWTNPEHEAWVIRLANDLESSGVAVTLDKWDLREGQDAQHFMEQMVRDPSITKVIMVCDRKYKERADARERGVGIETQIISQGVYSSTDQTKFVAVLSELDENDQPYIPIYYTGRIYIDLSTEDKYATNFQQLERWVYDKPLYQRPPRGKMPAYLSEDNPTILGTEAIARRCLDAIKTGKNYASGTLIEYFDTVYENLDRFHIQGLDIPDDISIAQFIYNKIQEFLPYRNEILLIVQTIAIYAPLEDYVKVLHNFFEKLSNYFYPKRKEGMQFSWREVDFDFYKFIGYELFLYVLAIFIKYEKYNSASLLLNNPYYIQLDTTNSRRGIVGCEFFNNYLDSIKTYYFDEMEKEYYSPIGELINERCNFNGITINQIAQADFIAFLNVDFKRKDNSNWYPFTQLYNLSPRNPYELFAKATSKSFFEQIKHLFFIEDISELKSLFDAFGYDRNNLPRIAHFKLNVFELSNFEQLATER